MSTASCSRLSPDGQIIVVFGASSGIGEGIARKIAQLHNPKDLILCARREDRLKAIRDDILGAASSRAQVITPYRVDVTDRAVVTALMESHIQPQMVSDPNASLVIVNSAGIMHFTLLKNGFFTEMENTCDINCKGTMITCMAALQLMMKYKTTAANIPRNHHIVNISSDAARQTFPALSVYNASKAFVHEFTKGLRCECVGTGIRVTEVQPGDVRTDLLMENKDKEAAEKVGVAIGEKVGGTNWSASDSASRSAVLDSEDVAEAVLYALTAPAHVGVNEVLIEPRDQMFGDPTSMAVS